MATIDSLHVLQEQLSSDAAILTDSAHPDFQALVRRWSDGDIQVPAAIILAATERDYQKMILWAREHNVAFVSKAGGHSPWSSIASPGVVIDLTRLSAVTVDKPSATARLTGAILSQDVTSALAAEGLFTALGNGNTVGAIPYFLGGGNNAFLPLTGYGAASILSARVITADGDLVTASAIAHPDLFWALRGAGRLFGLVLSLTVRAYPLTLLGSGRAVWCGVFVFTVSRAGEVARVMAELMEDARESTFGLIMLACPPPGNVPVVVISARVFAEHAEQARQAYQRIYELGPVVVMPMAEVGVEKLNEGLDRACAKGDRKEYIMVGMRGFNMEGFLTCVGLYQQLVTECPDAGRSVFNFHWHSRPAKKAAEESAMAFEDVRMWQSVLLWYTEEKSTERALKISDEVVVAMRGGQSEEQYLDFTSSTREGPIERRYGMERVERLRLLKRQWDPEGVFTRQFL